ncbi:MAG: nuclear transport factor 2 family protein [Chitinispirillaceae bacterium]
MDQDSFSKRSERELWDTVVLLWEYARAKNMDAVQGLIHPDYTGWEEASTSPQGYREALESVSSGMQIVEYNLLPRQVKVIDECVGVAHYVYKVQLLRADDSLMRIKGRWSEVYMKKDGRWVMISAQGGQER